MGTFSASAYRAVLEKNDQLSNKIADTINEIIEFFERWFDQWWIPPTIRDSVNALLWALREAAEGLFKLLEEVDEWANAPFTFDSLSGLWEAMVRPFTQLSLDIQNDLTATSHWQGTSETAYANVTTQQSGAVLSAGETFGSLATVLDACAGAGETFYIAIGVALVSLAAGVATALTGVGLALTVGLVAAAVTAIAGAAAAYLDMAITIRSQILAITTSDNESTLFVGGWPNADVGSGVAGWMPVG